MTEQSIEHDVENSVEDKVFEELGYEEDPNKLEDAEDFSEDEFDVPLDPDYVDVVEATHPEPYVEPEDGAQDPEAES